MYTKNYKLRTSAFVIYYTNGLPKKRAYFKKISMTRRPLCVLRFMMLDVISTGVLPKAGWSGEIYWNTNFSL